MKNTDRNKALLVEQLRKSPIVELACQKVSISRMTFYRWLKEDLQFSKSVDEAIHDGKSLVNDIAESQLISAVKEKNMPAVTYWLRHHHRDYTNRIEIKQIKQEEALTPEQEEVVREALRLASLTTVSNEIEINNNKQITQTNEESNITTGNGGADVEGSKSQNGNN